MSINPSALNVNDRVGIAHVGSWNVHSEGIYTVTKKDKMKVVLKRESDSYERSFSIKTGNELGRDNYRTTFLESATDQEQRNLERAHKTEIVAAWDKVKYLVEQREGFDEIETALQKVKELTAAYC